MLKTDPVAAMVDTWAFVYQMKNYFQQPALQTQLGQLQPVATETLSRMDEQMEQLVRTAAPAANVADMRKKIDPGLRRILSRAAFRAGTPWMRN